MNRFFKLKERNSSVITELIAGMTTFFAMVYILMVNANMSLCAYLCVCVSKNT